MPRLLFMRHRVRHKAHEELLRKWRGTGKTSNPRFLFMRVGAAKRHQGLSPLSCAQEDARAAWEALQEAA